MTETKSENHKQVIPQSGLLTWSSFSVIRNHCGAQMCIHFLSSWGRFLLGYFRLEWYQQHSYGVNWVGYIWITPYISFINDVGEEEPNGYNLWFSDTEQITWMMMIDYRPQEANTVMSYKSLIYRVYQIFKKLLQQLNNNPMFII